MNRIKLLNQVRSPENIELSFRYALKDRKDYDSYFDRCEIEYVNSCKEQIMEEILEELTPSDRGWLWCDDLGLWLGI